MPTRPTQLSCAACGSSPELDNAFPFTCPNRNPADDIEHLIERKLALDQVLQSQQTTNDLAGERLSFSRYRHRLHSYYRAIEAGLSDADFVEIIQRLDGAIHALDRRRFEVTPFLDGRALSRAIGLGDNGRIWVKDETNNVSGSHKARHMMGIMLHLEAALAERGADLALPELAIASCGNAALAAAVVARAAHRPLRVFIPTDASQLVVERLLDLGVELMECPRSEGELGDPCYLRFREAVAAGLLPFTCQGTDNGLTIEGGMTLGYELVDQLRAQKVELDYLFIQVGGAALASACTQAIVECHQAGLIAELPRFVTVQTQGAFPLARAWERLTRRIEARLDGKAPPALEPHHDLESRDATHKTWSNAAIAQRLERADRLKMAYHTQVLQAELQFAANHRSLFMWPWEEAPKSVAHGILDDETYDWMATIRAMLSSGGYPIVVDEQTLLKANTLARTHMKSAVCHTGSSGLAGVLAAHQAGVLSLEHQIAVLFTGIDRQTEANS